MSAIVAAADAVATDAVPDSVPEVAVAPSTTDIDELAAKTSTVTIAASAVDALDPSEPASARVKKAASLPIRQQAHLSAGVNFDDPSLKIPQPLIDSLLNDFNFEKPSQIQAVTIPRMMKGYNVIAQAQTGSGKTIAFTIGMLACVDVSQPTVQALCLAPTRELATQIIDDAVSLMASRVPGLRYELLVRDEDRQLARCTAHVVVGTPGTIMKLAKNNYLYNLKNTVKVFVCDEADEMIEEREKGQTTFLIKKMLKPNVQCLFFSATFPEAVLNYGKEMAGGKSSIIKLETNEQMVVNSIFQVIIDVSSRAEADDESKKLVVLKEIYQLLEIDQSIVFTNSRDESQRVANLLTNDNYSVSFIHGGLDGAARDDAVRKFRNGLTKVLVCTNVLARGMDVPAVDLVINFGVPLKYPKRDADPLTYLHRIGRCGRFGRAGTAVTLISVNERRPMTAIEQYFNFPDGRMARSWEANRIESLAEAVRERASDATASSVALEVSITVDDSTAVAKK